MIQERLSTFAGLPVHTFDGEPDGPLPVPEEVAWGIYHRVHDNGVRGAEVPENFDRFLAGHASHDPQGRTAWLEPEWRRLEFDVSCSYIAVAE